MVHKLPSEPTEQSIYKLATADLQSIFLKLKEQGYRIVGPVVRDGAIIYDELSGIEDLPQGWQDEQSAGKYRLVQTENKHYFAFASSPHSWKKFLQPSRIKLWESFSKPSDEGSEISFFKEKINPEKFAFFGVRSCDLHAVRILDRVYKDERQATGRHYFAVRDHIFILSIDCSHPSRNCFCTSMETGPAAESDYDLALTEICQGDEHLGFTARVGSQLGLLALQDIPCQEADSNQVKAAQNVIENSKRLMPEKLETADLKNLLYSNLDHPRWDHVADRCLTCANCTMVCPTCFCQTVEDITDLTGEHTERWLRWDSCFTLDFSYIHGGSIRKSTKARYRQWLTHKLASWIDQFDVSGCVGCGRCITWCPVGIDLTEEVRAIRESQT